MTESVLFPYDEKLARLFELIAIGPELIEFCDHYVDGETLRDWWQQLRVQLRRAELLEKFDLLDDQAVQALERRIRIWRKVFDAHVRVAA